MLSSGSPYTSHWCCFVSENTRVLVLSSKIVTWLFPCTTWLYVWYLMISIGIWFLSFEFIWVFPKIMVSPNHPILIGFSIINHPFWGVSLFFGNTHMIYEPASPRFACTFWPGHQPSRSNPGWRCWSSLSLGLPRRFRGFGKNGNWWDLYESDVILQKSAAWWRMSTKRQGTTGCTSSNSVPMVFIVFSRDSWGF